jgi:hypothetical protein
MFIFTLITLTCPEGSSQSKLSLITKTAAITILILMCIFTRFGNVSLYKKLIFPLPGLGAIRAVSRVILAMSFLYSVVIAFSITLLHRKATTGLRKFFYYFLVVACISEQLFIPSKFYTYSKADVVNRHRQLTQRVILDDTPFFNVRSKTSKDRFYPCCAHIDAMFASIFTGQPTINGYSGMSPKEYNRLNELDQSSLQEWMILHGLKSVRIIDTNQTELLTISD